MLYGVARGGHKYQVWRRKVYLPNLPAAFEGFKIVQLSDIHSGSFYSREGVQKGIDLVNAQKADLVVFTGDLVNNVATEIEPWIDHFKQIQSPHGVYSILGNHDYGDYASWASPEAKAANLRDLIDNHARLGWQILLDEHRYLEKDGQRIALLGIQNWGAKANFPKYGNLAKAHAGAEAPVKILLSHDPSHWHAQVRPEYPDIDLMLAGHTHGMQFGIDNQFLKWSPVQYVYKQWAGMYQDGSQQLYVNRGFGFIGYPGRFGIWPEITVLELTAKPLAG
jgi:predicted MPP superfamily phosphohydrolase